MEEVVARWWCRWWYSGLEGRGEEERTSARRSSAAITGCQLAKKSNARFPSLCDAMLMACRCLFSTRCLHTWLDPRGISEMFLALIRNHILLLSPLPGCVYVSSLSLLCFPLILPDLSFSSHRFILRLPRCARTAIIDVLQYRSHFRVVSSFSREYPRVKMKQQ